MSCTYYRLGWSIGIHDTDSSDPTDPIFTQNPNSPDRETIAVQALQKVMDDAGQAFITAHPGVYDTNLGLI